MARVLGVGPGVFVLAFFLVLFIVIVVAFSKTSMSGGVTVGCVVAYGILAMILFLTPRGPKSQGDLAVGYDSNGVGRVIVLTFMVLGLLMAFASKLVFVWTPVRIARPIDYFRDVLKRR